MGGAKVDWYGRALIILGGNCISGYRQLMINHSVKEFVKGEVYTNGIESVWVLGTPKNPNQKNHYF